MSQNKLQLVDPIKLNELLDLLKKDMIDKNMVQNIVNKDEFQLNEAKALITNKKGNPLQEEKIIDFLKKK